jgi:hypothetical protein
MDQDVRGIEVPLPRRTEVIARVTVVDEKGLVVPNAPIPSGIGLAYRSARSGGSGGLQLALSPGDSSVSLKGTPAEYSVKSITSGQTDLMKSTLNVDLSSPSIDVELTLQRKKR